MKKIPHLIILIVVCSFFQACPWVGTDDDFIGEEFSNYEPVIMDRNEFENSFSLETTARTIENAGKIYTKDDFIFINEVNKGFHIINNTDPTTPENIGFIEILGSSDLSIKGVVFYANSATDLIAFTINESNQNISLTKRVRNTFPQLLSPEGLSYTNLNQDQVIVDWVPID